MGLLREQLAIDSEVFVNSDELGENVVYTPSGESAVTILATVIREAAEKVPGAGSSQAQVLEIWIRNHATLGRSSINVGGDTVAVPLRHGGTAKTLPITEVLEGEAGMWRLRVR